MKNLNCLLCGIKIEESGNLCEDCFSALKYKKFKRRLNHGRRKRRRN